MLLNLVKAHAVLHQATRDRDAEGRIIATITDYERVRGLVVDLLAEGIEATVPPAVREAVQAVAKIHATKGAPVSVKEVAASLGLDKSAASRRVGGGVRRGYLINHETRKGQPSRLEPGEPLPEDQDVLPLGQALERCSVAAMFGGLDHPSPPSKVF
jgi:hypothetical protein